MKRAAPDRQYQLRAMILNIQNQLDDRRLVRNDIPFRIRQDDRRMHPDPSPGYGRLQSPPRRFIGCAVHHE
ncbi:hypothetical protein D1872_298390 [compost metagenome]